ncbi:MAG: radical SAM protein [Bacillota bacterium]|uniref:Radical SAM protein n=1 Tax=Thermanaerosceptrum fracticalcis TaxID=1712410 RepID=A0A7G6E761_THEFR|nr:radical SAM protein [Thermanaerosceptrum fracticalcis]QNB47915.1 radical SAM protein [Thermanaerosceptrum fracticalcis]
MNLTNCRICPWECGVNRLAGEKGVCQAGGELKIAKAFLHPWEEPCISGTRGSGTIFFTHCNLKCVYCQNYKISQEHFGKEISISRFADICLSLQEKGAHNINLVSPTQFIPLVKAGLKEAKDRGLSIPVVYNGNGYEKVGTLKELNGLIDVYLPDLKYFSNEHAVKYSGVPNYFSIATGAIKEMYRQVGVPRFNDEGIILKGLIIRHLLLPGLEEDSRKILEWIARELPREVYLSLMGQYTPVHRAPEFPALARPVGEEAYEEMIDYFFQLGLENGFVQELTSSDVGYIPDFDLAGLE